LARLKNIRETRNGEEADNPRAQAGPRTHGEQSRHARPVQYFPRRAPLVSRFAELSMAPVEPERATPAALEALLKSEIGRWGLIIKQAGIEPQ